MPQYVDSQAVSQKSPFACGAACAVFITKALGVTSLDKVSTAMKSTSTMGMVECFGSTPWLVARYVLQKRPATSVYRLVEAQPKVKGGLTFAKSMFGTMKADLAKHVPVTITSAQYQDGDVILRMHTPGKWSVASHFVVETRFQSPAKGSAAPMNRIQIMDPMQDGLKSAGFTTYTDYDTYLTTASAQTDLVRTGLDLLFRR